MIQLKTRSASRPCWISSLSRTSTSGRAGHTVTGTGRKKVAENSTRQNNFKRGVERRNTKTFTIDSSAIRRSEKTMIELGRSEEIILEMNRLASEDHSHIATQEEIDVYRGNWWIRSNVVNFDTMPTRRQPDFKKALSTLYRLKKAEHKKKWSQSSSSWWQRQTTWWDPYYENSPQRWSEHWSNGETCVLSESTVHLWHESQQEFDANFIVIISVTVNAVYRHRRSVSREHLLIQQFSNKMATQKCTMTSTPSRPMWTMTTVTRRTSTSTTCARSEHACTLFRLSRHSHWYITFPLAQVSWVCHPILTPCTCAVVSGLLHFSFYLSLHFTFFFLSFLSMYSDDFDSVTNNLRDSANGTFVTLDDVSHLTFGPCTERCDVGFCSAFDLVQYRRGWRLESEQGGCGPVSKIHARRVRLWSSWQNPCTERCVVGVSLRPYLGWRMQDKFRDLLHRSPHAFNPRVEMPTCCQMCGPVAR